MQLVARDFYALLQASFIMKPQERLLFKRALLRDDLTWFAKWKRVKSSAHAVKAFCSACQAPRIKSQFDEQAIAKDPGVRLYVGAKETVKLHGWQEMKLNDLFNNTMIVPGVCKL